MELQLQLQSSTFWNLCYKNVAHQFHPELFVNYYKSRLSSSGFRECQRTLCRMIISFLINFFFYLIVDNEYYMYVLWLKNEREVLYIYVNRFFLYLHHVSQGQHKNLYIVKIDGGGGKVYLYTQISLIPLKRGNSAVEIDGGGGGQGVYGQGISPKF